MKIKQARIFNYGKWHHVVIPFNEGLNILYGNNEAGKTTLISFIKGILFGYLQRRTSHKNYIPRHSKNYGGQLDLLSDNKEYVVQRMSGKNGGQLTILDPDGNQLDNSILSKILGPFNRETFNALYYFGTVNLQKMGKLKQRDLIYRIQRIGLANSDQWINYREALVKQAKQIYAPQGYKPPLNQSLKQYDKLIDQAKVAKESYQDYQRLLTMINELTENRTDLNQEIKATDQHLSQLERDQNAWLRYQKMLKLQPVMKRSLRQGFAGADRERLRKLRRRINDLNNRVKLLRQQIKEISQQKVIDDSVADYQKHQKLIEKLADHFNDVQVQIHQLSLLRDRYTDIQKQLKGLKPRYTVNNYLLSPMSTDDLQTAQTIRTKAEGNQTAARNMNRKLINLQSHNNISVKDTVLSGLGLILMIAGIVIKLWLLVGLGIVILILGSFVLLHKIKLPRIKINQLKTNLENIQNSDKVIDQHRQSLQNKYHYQKSNVAEWVINQNNLRQLLRLTEHAQKLGRHINHLEHKVHNYFESWAFMNRILTLSSDGVNELMQLKNYVNKMERITKTNRKADEKDRVFKTKFNQLTRLQKRITEALANFYRKRQIKDANDFITIQGQQTKLSQQRKMYRDLSKQIGSGEINALKKYRTLNDLKETIDKVNQQIMDLRERSQQITSKLTATQVKLDKMAKNGSYDELQQRIANCKTQINELANRWLEESLASQWINATLNLATKGRVPKIERQAKQNFQILTNHRYSSIIFNKSKIKVMRDDKHRFTLYELSKGTVQQLYLALIFAMAQVFSSDYPMPILIDDGFTDFDVHRKRAALRLLKVISQTVQVIYCSSDNTLIDRSETLNLMKIKPDR